MTDNPPITKETDRAVKSCQRQLPDELKQRKVVFGFDGIIDTVREVVAERQGSDQYVSLTELGALGEQISASAAVKNSLLLEWVDKGTRTGGHVSHLSRAFGELGFNPVLVGTLGQPPHDEFVEEFGEYTMLSVGKPGYVDAIEFNDGKLMMAERGGNLHIDWNTICDRVGLETLAEHLEGAHLMGIGYWAVLLNFPSIINGICKDLLPIVSDPPDMILIDPSDIRQLTSDQLIEGIDPIQTLNEVVPVTMSANRSETSTLSDLFGNSSDSQSLAKTASIARDNLGVSQFVAHSIEESVVVSENTSACVEVPRVNEPLLTTSAGDHFNVGFTLGMMEGLSDGAALVLGNTVAGLFVRNGEPPSYEMIQSFVDSYPRKF